MQFRVVPGTSTSIYRQIADQVRRAIAAGELAVGDPVPSVRALAKELVINPNTVAKAYAELIRDGVLESQAGRGAYVAPKREVYAKAERLRRLDEALDNAISTAIALHISGDEILARMQSKLSKLKV